MLGLLGAYTLVRHPDTDCDFKCPHKCLYLQFMLNTMQVMKAWADSDR